MPFYPLLGEGSPTKIDNKEKQSRIYQLVPTSLLEDLGKKVASTCRLSTFLGDTSPFFPGILLFRKLSEPQEKQRPVFEKNDAGVDLGFFPVTPSEANNKIHIL